MSEQKEYRIAAVDRALQVMEALAAQPGQGVTEIATRLGMTKSIVFRILHTLEARGFVTKDDDRALYALGYRVSVLGERAGSQRGLLQAARDEMEKLRDSTDENVNLIVRDQHRSLVVATREGRHSMRIFAQAGRRGPLHAGGGSMLLLAFAPPDVRTEVLSRPLKRYTAHTITDAKTLEPRLQRIRKRGWNIAQNDLDEGAFSVAAPIYGAGDEVVAAISVAGALARFDEDRRERYLAAVQAAAARISRRLGLDPVVAVDEAAA